MFVLIAGCDGCKYLLRSRERLGLPLDKWFGSFHDGSDESQKRMNDRFMATAKRRQEKQAARAARRKG